MPLFPWSRITVQEFRRKNLTHGEVVEIMKQNSAKLRLLLEKTLTRIKAEADCSCRHAWRKSTAALT